MYCYSIMGSTTICDPNLHVKFHVGNPFAKFLI